MSFVLTTPRLALREMTRDDLPFLAAMLGHPEVMRFYPDRIRQAGAEPWLDRQLSRYERDGHGLWLVVDRVSGEPLGQAGLVRQDVEGASLPEIGYLIHRPFWRRGYASEAAVGIRDQAFGERGLEAVFSLIRPENLPSQGVARKLGMKPRREVDFHGLRHLLFGVTRTAPKPPRAAGRRPSPSPRRASRGAEGRSD
jgi:ribosomal-protein-alanine N-acetyltransferase